MVRWVTRRCSQRLSCEVVEKWDEKEWSGSGAKGERGGKGVSSKYHQSNIIAPMVEQVGDMGRRTHVQ